MLKFIGGVVVLRLLAGTIAVVVGGGLIYLAVRRLAGTRDVAG